MSERFQPVFEAAGELWSSTGGLLGDVGGILSSIGDGLSSLAGNEDAIGILDGMGRSVGFLAGLAVDGIAATLRLINGVVETVRGVLQGDWDATLAPVQELFDWLASIDVTGLLPDIDAAAVVATIAGWFDFEWADLLPDWNWGDIIPSLSSFFGQEQAPLLEQLDAINNQGLRGNLIGNFAEDVAAYESGVISVLELHERLSSESGTFGAAGVAKDLSAAIEKSSEYAEALAEIERAAAPVTVASIAADTAQIDEISSKIEAASAIAAALPREVATAVAAAEREANLDLRPAGEAAARSFAEGIRAGTPAAVAAARAMNRAVAAETARGTGARRNTALHDGADHDL